MTKAYKLSENNQPIWEQFAELRLSEVLENQKSKGKPENIQSAKVNVAQYKEAAILLDSICKDWNHLLVDDLDVFAERKPHRVNHLNGMLTTCILKDWVFADRNVVVELIPLNYRELAKLLF